MQIITDAEIYKRKTATPVIEKMIIRLISKIRTTIAIIAVNSKEFLFILITF
ncbi:unnamed protein product [marine sediment metagenome]|uniref:Uncharacterized protein n=1 Tax=marine sediment metagenome TaxID=412755 RepID=X0Z0V8_9ZZZZ